MLTRFTEFIKFEAAFVEETVFLVIKNHEETGNFHTLVELFYQQKDPIYEMASESDREVEFRKFYEHYFTQLGLRCLFEEAFAEFPLLVNSKLPIFIRQTSNPKQEGAELYVTGEMKTIVVKLRVTKILDKPSLQSFLRQELMHISDMLDPAFGYSPEAPLGGSSQVENNLIRDRFRQLWNEYAATRVKGISVKSYTQKELIQLAHEDESKGFLKELTPSAG